MSHRTHHGRLAAQHTETAFECYATACLCLLLLLAVLAIAGCDTRRPAAAWLDRRDLAEVAHCPPPPLLGDAVTCQYLAWEPRP